MKYFDKQYIWDIGNKYVCRKENKYIDPCFKCGFFKIDKELGEFFCQADDCIVQYNCYKMYFKQIFYV